MAAPVTREDNQEHVWEVAKAHAEFTVHELSAASHRSVDYVRASLRDWKGAGYVEQAGKRARHTLWKITDKEGAPVSIKTPTQSARSAPERMWFAIRKATSIFNADDLAMWTNTPDLLITPEDAQVYCRTLLRAGYLRCEVKADGAGRRASYRLVKNTGPRPPELRRIRALWDPNTEAFIPQTGGVS